MKKEIIISILVGLIFGLIVVYGVYTAQSSLTEPEATQAPLTTSPSPKTDVEAQGQLVIHNPIDETITDQKTITITGSSQDQSYLVIFVNETAAILKPDESGHFSTESELELGSNIIQVHAINQDGQTTTQERTVIYTTQPLVETKIEAKSSTASAETSQDE